MSLRFSVGSVLRNGFLTVDQSFEQTAANGLHDGAVLMLHHRRYDLYIAAFIEELAVSCAPGVEDLS